jgi:hypothetical protein
MEKLEILYCSQVYKLERVEIQYNISTEGDYYVYFQFKISKFKFSQDCPLRTVFFYLRTAIVYLKGTQYEVD